MECAWVDTVNSLSVVCGMGGFDVVGDVSGADGFRGVSDFGGVVGK